MHFVTATESAAQYANGHLLYRTSAALVAQPFDPKSGALLGPATAVVNNLRDDVGVWRSISPSRRTGFWSTSWVAPHRKEPPVMD
jgi:hypothetical protein